MHFPLYLDPGSGSFLLQLLLGVLLGGGLAVRLFWKQIKALFTGKKEPPKEETTAGQDDDQ